MPQATFIHDGSSIDYTPSGDVAAGDVVVQGDLVGVAIREIKAGRLGALAVRGAFDVTKEAATAFAAGDAVFWEATSHQAVDSGALAFGRAVADAPSGAATVRTLLTPGGSLANPSAVGSA